MSAFLTATERATFYPRQIFDESGLCVCANCLDCDPSLFRGMKKPRQCVVCECYNLREIKRFEKEIHCLDCYREANNARRRKQRKAKKEAEKKAEEEEVCICRGCNHAIVSNTGFCSEGCRFGEFAGVWKCDKCGERCEDCEFCPTCGPEEEAEADFATEWNQELTTDERVALLAKTFDNKADSDDEEEEEKESFEEFYEREKDCRCNAWSCDACQYRIRKDNDKEEDKEEDEEEDEEEEEEETWRCEECGRDDMREEDIGGHLKEGGCVCNDCFRDDDDFKKKICFGNL